MVDLKFVLDLIIIYSTIIKHVINFNIAKQTILKFKILVYIR